MRKQIYLGWLLAFVGLGQAGAATLTLDAGALFGQLDETVGWGFTITKLPIDKMGDPATPPWLVITSADFVPDFLSSPVGVFTAFITQLPESNVVIGTDTGNGEINPWSQPFDDALLSGIGSYHINDFQAIGDQVTGAIVLSYDAFSVSPNDPAFNPDTDTIAVGQIMSAPASVTVVGTPEPGTASLLLLAGLLFGTWAWARSPIKV